MIWSGRGSCEAPSYNRRAARSAMSDSERFDSATTSSSEGETIGSGYLVPLTHHDVASLIGAARQTTTTILNDLERRGIIELGRGSIRVKRLKELQTYA